MTPRPAGAPDGGRGADADAVDLQETARRLGVHYMTAYRYVRTGRLPASRRDGRWWVWPADLERFRAGTPRTPGRRRLDPAVAAQRLCNRMVAGDEPGAWRILESVAISGAGPTSAVLDVLAPALRRIGDGWQRGDLTVGDEHRASAVAARLLGRLGPALSRPGRPRGVVLLACVPGERHALPVALLATVLRGEGYDVVELGADTPADVIAASARDAGSRLRAVGLSVGSAALRRSVPETIRVVRAATGDTPVLLGGPAVRSRRQARALGADDWAPDAAGMAALLEHR